MCYTHIRSLVHHAESKNEKFQNFETVFYRYGNNGYTKTDETASGAVLLAQELRFWYAGLLW